MSYTKLPILFVAITLIALPLGAGAISSTSYQMDPTTFGASAKSVTSTTYQMDAIVDVAGGRETTSSFVLEAGGASPYYCGDGFIDPGHVSAIIGSKPYEILGVAQVITGFEAQDILEGILMLLAQIKDGRKEVENQ